MAGVPQPYLGDLFTMVIYHLLTAMILQVLLVVTSRFCRKLWLHHSRYGGHRQGVEMGSLEWGVSNKRRSSCTFTMHNNQMWQNIPSCDVILAANKRRFLVKIGLFTRTSFFFVWDYLKRLRTGMVTYRVSRMYVRGWDWLTSHEKKNVFWYGWKRVTGKFETYHLPKKKNSIFLSTINNK